jgi:hypothetical protein
MKALKNQLKTWSKEHIRVQEEKLKRLEELLTGFFYRRLGNQALMLERIISNFGDREGQIT